MKRKWVWSAGLALTLVLALVPARPGRAATITVNTTNDVLDAAGSCGAVTLASLPGPDGVISLRDGLCAANGNPGPDTIAFAIPGPGGHTIQPLVALPILSDDETTIDGYSQPGTAEATGTTPATLLIEISGVSIASNNGLSIASAGNVIRGLVINRFPWNGIAIGDAGATGNVIAGNHIGTSPASTLDRSNGLTVQVTSSPATWGTGCASRARAPLATS
jgi:hypothetical protein